MSDGNRSLVNWIRRNVPPSDAASARARVVLPTPGMSSIRRWPRESSATIEARIASGLPRTTAPTASSSLRTAPMSVDEIGADAVTAGMSDEYSPETQDGDPEGPRRAVASLATLVAQAHQELQHV